MIRLKIESNKVLKLFESGKVYITENNIQSFHIELPSTFGDVPIKELTLELRCYLPDDNYSGYMGYNVPTTDGSMVKIPITNDITEEPQIVKLMFIATKDGNVIGKTNFVDLQIYDAPLKGEPLTPRKDFDEVINEQRATIESQSETITEQQSTITQQSSQITELNGEVTELQGEVAEQQATISRQNTTIDELNRRVPPLQTLDPINPSTQQVTYRPSGDNVGFNPFIVNGATCEGLGVNPEYYKAGEPCIDKVGSYAPFQALGGVYVTEEDEYGYPVSILVKNFKAYVPFPRVWNAAALAKVEFNNCPTITSFSTTLRPFNGIRTLRIVLLPNGITTFGAYDFADCTNLIRIHIPNSLQTIASPPSTVFNNCSTLEYVTIENGFNCNSLNLAVSTRYSHDTILSWFNALADRTGETAYTLTIGSTNLNKMTAEEKAIATNKNWNIA